MHHKLTRLSVALAALSFLSPTLKADDWPQWRGPRFDGSTAEQHLPDSLDPATATWSTPLPGPSSATPVVLGDKVFLGALERGSKKLLALRVNASDGKVVWQKEISLGVSNNQRNDLASPSPIATPDEVIFYYGTGDLAAFDHDGNPKWSRSLTKDYGPFNILWLYSSSPLLFDHKLYVPVLQRDHSPNNRNGGGGGGPSMADSYLLCLDPATGKELWRVVRPTDAVEEAREAYTTPIPITVDGKAQIVLMGGDHLTGHDAATGKELWRTPTYNPGKVPHWRTVASATFGAGLVFASAPKDGKLFAAIPNDGSSPEAKLAWQSKDVSTDVCAPLFYDGKLYVLNGDGKKTLTCLDPRTGDKEWSLDLGGRAVYRASPTAADGKIYCLNEAGEAAVVSTADHQILARATFPTEPPVRSTIVVADGHVLVRTADKLYAFGGKK